MTNDQILTPHLPADFCSVDILAVSFGLLGSPFFTAGALAAAKPSTLRSQLQAETAKSTHATII
jgi:hypothetical protein